MKTDRETKAKFNLVNSPNATEETLSSAKDDESYIIREAVARHKNTNIETLVYLKDDEEKRVLSALAHNENTPPEVLDFLSEKHFNDSVILYFIVGNPNASEATKLKISNTCKDYDIQNKLATTISTPNVILESIAQSRNHQLASAAKRTLVLKKTNPQKENNYSEEDMER